eukprot:12327323-Alexandrium_andersonii.AAC.1
MIRASLDAQDGEVRWVDHCGMCVDALTKRGGNVPLLQVLMRTATAGIAEESATLAHHPADPKTWSSQAKTR